MDAPEHFPNQKMLCLVMDWRKQVQDGVFETVYALRHLTDPVRCSWFAFAFELFCQIHLQGLGFAVSDFVPVRISKGKYHHYWYNRRFFIGHTQSTKGQPSRPDPYLDCSYESTRKAFIKLYSLIEPAIESYHKLHLQRGTSARMAELDGCEVHQIGAHGGWKRNGVLYNNYLNGIPIDFVKWVAGYKVDEKAMVYPEIKRACVRPPQTLIDRVFPFMKEVKLAMASDYDENGGQYKMCKGHDNTLLGFLKLCDYAAEYLLQDLAVMYDWMNLHEVFSLPLLCEVEFFEFRDELLEEMSKKPDPKPTRNTPEQFQYLEGLLEKIYRMLGERGVFHGNDEYSEEEVAAQSEELEDVAMVMEHFGDEFPAPARPPAVTPVTARNPVVG